MILRPFLLEVNEANVYLIGCKDSRHVALVDAGDCDPDIVDYLEEQKLELTAIIVTHGHYDHTGGIPGFLSRYNPRIYSAGTVAEGGHTIQVGHGDSIPVGRLLGRVVKTSGHTPDSISIVFPGVVFTGDALFAGSVGGTSSPVAAQEEIRNVREHILSLPDDYVIYPGHGPASTVWVERTANPFFA